MNDLYIHNTPNTKILYSYIINLVHVQVYMYTLCSILIVVYWNFFRETRWESIVFETWMMNQFYEIVYLRKRNTLTKQFPECGIQVVSWKQNSITVISFMKLSTRSVGLSTVLVYS